MIEKIQGEFDNKKQIDMSHELIRYMTGQTYFIPRPRANRSLRAVVALNRQPRHQGALGAEQRLADRGSDRLVGGPDKATLRRLAGRNDSS